VQRRVVVDEAVVREPGAARVEPERDVELLGERVHGLVRLAVGVVVAHGARERQRDEPEVGDDAAGFLEGVGERLQRQRRRGLQPVGRGRAVPGEPVVVRAAAGHGEVDVGQRVEAEADRAVEDRHVDPLGVHVDEARLRVGRAVPLGRRLADPLRDPGPPTRAGRDHAAVEQVPRRAAFVLDEARATVEEAPVEMLLPERVGFEDMAVEVDDRQPGRGAHRTAR
jgi:hypothetical protein